MHITFINNTGNGFADRLDIADGTTVSSLFATKIGGDPNDYLIRVNREQVHGDYVLSDNDRVSVTSRKIEGARS